MTVPDTSAVIDHLDEEPAGAVGALLAREGLRRAPDVLVFEVLAVL